MVSARRLVFSDKLLYGLIIALAVSAGLSGAAAGSFFKATVIDASGASALTVSGIDYSNPACVMEGPGTCSAGLAGSGVQVSFDAVEPASIMHISVVASNSTDTILRAGIIQPVEDFVTCTSTGVGDLDPLPAPGKTLVVDCAFTPSLVPGAAAAFQIQVNWTE